MGVALTRIPNLSPLSDDGDSVAGRPTMTPPLHFRAIRGVASKIRIDFPKYQRAHGNTAARHAGLAYEAKVQSELIRMFPPYYPEPTIDFYDYTGWRRVKPDGILPSNECNILVEIKIRSMPETWYQTEELYKPLLEKLLGKPVRSLHIVRSYDPAATPAEVRQITKLDDWMDRGRGVGVFEWRL